MELLDCRRLTGPNLVSDRPCAVLEAALAPEEAEGFLAEWQRQARTMLDAIGWTGESTAVLRCTGGALCVLSAPADGLYAATEIAEWAWHATRAVLSGEEDPGIDVAADAAGFARVIAEEANPALLALAHAAREHGVTFLADDERASVGLGTGVRSWPVRALPAPADVPWKGVHDIPVALIAGTHGKTTCARLVAAIVTAAGKRAGYASNDAMVVGDEVIERGDCSDAEGARHVLRERRVQIAALELGRSGLLHRGLAVPRATAALITAAVPDRLDRFGAQTLAELIEVQWILTRALQGQNTLVLNAEDPALVARAADYSGPIVWFARDPAHPLLLAQADGSTAWSVRDGVLGYTRGRTWRGIVAAAEIPIALGGSARHNVANALAAAALAQALGLPERAIASGLRAAQRDAHPGRANLFEVGGVRVLVDSARNPHALGAIAELVLGIPAQRRLLAFGALGDRRDEVIMGLAKQAAVLRPDRVLISEPPACRRGREPDEIYIILRDELLRLGFGAERIERHEDELHALEAAIAWAQAGDLVVVLPLLEMNQVLERLHALEEGMH